MAAGLIVALLAGLMAFIFLQRAALAPQAAQTVARVPALFATKDIPVHTPLTAADVEVRQVPAELLAQDTLAAPEDAVGMLSTTGIAAGEAILSRRLIAPDYVGPRVALSMAPDQVAIAFGAEDLLSTLDVYQAGDHVDIMVSLDPDKGGSGPEAPLQTLTALQDVRVAAVMRNSAAEGKQGSVRAILLAVDPQDALMLKHFRDAGAVADLALRSPAAEGEFDVNPVDTDYLSSRYDIVSWRGAR